MLQEAHMRPWCDAGDTGLPTSTQSMACACYSAYNRGGKLNLARHWERRLYSSHLCLEEDKPGRHMGLAEPARHAVAAGVAAAGAAAQR